LALAGRKDRIAAGGSPPTTRASASFSAALRQLRQGGFAYPCSCSRKDLQSAARAPHADDDEEPIYPGTCRPAKRATCAVPGVGERPALPDAAIIAPANRKSCWRFQVPDGEAVSFVDGRFGPQTFVAGRDFGDFVVWRNDDVPAYQLACVVDDAAMRITEVVRGADLLISTARQLLLYRALRLEPPRFYHCPLMTDHAGLRLAKRHDALSLRSLRARGVSPEELRQGW
jgi:glutamyl/glutaminyl-tRNA synthetase